MKFYAYLGNHLLGEEPLGSENKLMFELKTVKGAKNRCVRAFGKRPYVLFSYTNFYDNKTFKEIHRGFHVNMYGKGV